MGSLGVVEVAERVAERLELRDCCGLRLLFEPAFQGLLEAFDFAAGGWVVRV